MKPQPEYNPSAPNQKGAATHLKGGIESALINTGPATAVQFLSVLHPNGGDVEIRTQRRGGHVHSCGLPDAASASAMLPDLVPDGNANIWVGVGTRRRGERNAAGVTHIAAAWADVDFKHFGGDREAALSALDRFALPPSIVVETGGGFQAYWRLDAAVTSDFSRLEALNRGLARALGPAGGQLDDVSDRARVLRVPGTFNLKYDPPRLVNIVQWEPERRYGLDLLEAHVPLVRPADNGHGLAPPLPEEIPEGDRNNAMTSLAGSMRRRGASEAGILAALQVVNADQCQPALDEAEVRGIARGVASRYAPEHVLASVGVDATFVESDLSVEPPPVSWTVDGIVPASGITMPYGEGGTGKTAVMMAMAVCICAGEPFLGQATASGPVIWIDTEMGEEDARRRLWEVSRGLGLDHPPPNLHLFSTFDSLLDVFAEVTAAVLRLQPVAVFIDSLGAALGGTDATPAHNINPLMSRLQTIGIPVILLDHQAKLQAGESYTAKMPFGSVYKFNRARSVWQIEKAEFQGAGTLELLLRHIKSTFGPLRREPLGVRLAFEAASIRVETVDVADSPGLLARLPKEHQVLQAVRRGAETVTEIMKATDLSDSAVRNHLSRLSRRGQVRKEESSNRREADHWFAAGDETGASQKLRRKPPAPIKKGRRAANSSGFKEGRQTGAKRATKRAAQAAPEEMRILGELP
jgi:DNA-binding transcriptional ArsR family regulator